MAWHIRGRFQIIDSRNAELICKIDDDIDLLKDKIIQLKNDNHTVQYYYIVDANKVIKIIPIMLMLI